MEAPGTPVSLYWLWPSSHSVPSVKLDADVTFDMVTPEKIPFM